MAGIREFRPDSVPETGERHLPGGAARCGTQRIIKPMKEWGFAQTNPNEELAQVHYFSMKKHQASGGEIEFLITVKEYITPKEPTMHFFAQADKETNQN